MAKDFKYYAKIANKHKFKKHEKEYEDFKKKYGFRREQCWNLDVELIAWLLPRIAYLKEHHSGVPNCYCELDENYNAKDIDKASEKWESVLQEILDGFEIYLDKSLNRSSDEREKIDRAFELLIENIGNLWD